MAQNLLFVSSDEHFYGLHPNNEPEIWGSFCDMVVGSPSPELLERIQSVIRRKNVQAIITRGSWTIYLKENLSIPVFPLKIDACDIYRYLNNLSRQGYRRVGFIIYSYSPDEAQSEPVIEAYQFGDFELFVSHVSSHPQLVRVTDEIISVHRAQYIIGDVETMQAAVRSGVPGSVIELESVYVKESISQAQYITQLTAADHNRMEYITTILNLISEAVITFTPEGQILHCNSAAAAMFPKITRDTAVQELIGMPLAELVSLQVNKLLLIGGGRYIANILSTHFQGAASYALILYNTRHIQEVELSLRKQQQERGMTAKYSFTDMIAVDANTLRVVDMAKKYAHSQGTILICGETGTGKEILASSIHNESPRKNGPFVALNCATLSESLVESELFGYEKGAFTGARSNGKKGLFELAHRGTIFLDEIGDLPLNLQVKLLRVLQEREIMHIGGDRIIPVDVRVIAATNRDLKAMMKQGKFREDLYYRLDLLELHLLPLRDRPQDIIPLFLHFLDTHMYKNDRHLSWPSLDIFRPLLRYSWPGNIRELENLAERIVLLADRLVLDEAFIAEHLTETNESAADSQCICVPITSDFHMLESVYVRQLLGRFNGDRAALCKFLNISRPTLWRKLNYTPENQPSAIR